jgi:two-component system, chemotaxis family, chemotaxis protein CheY
MATILVVDDSAYARRRIRQLLEAEGHAVSEASSGLSGLESYVMEMPDLVMLDLTMEDLSGLDVLARLREVNPDVRVIVVSADVQRSTATMVAAAGAFRFLGKPADAQDVVEAVNAALREVSR